MPQYFFVLGKNHTLSCTEIISVLHKLNIPFEIKILSQEILIIKTDKDMLAENIMKTLGGVVKIGMVLDEVGFDEEEQKFENIFSAGNLVNKYLTKTGGKLHLGISIYDGGTDKNYLAKMTNQLKTLNISVKDNLREKGLKMGFVRIKERYLSSVSVWKNQLLTRGVEIVLILSKDKILVGKTQAVQEFESFSFRDYGRPERDKRSGIMPPKLSRMMINLAQIPQDGVILDPFCGSGTILQEALILGYKNLIGTDISINAVNDTKKNIEWLFNNFRHLNKSSYNINIFQSDVRSITNKIRDNSIDAIITEPYLGPPLFKAPDITFIKKIIDEVSPLYIAAFKIFNKILKINGKVIFLFPAFEAAGKMHFIEILDKIEKAGFKRLDYFPAEMKINPTIRLTQRNTILYGSREHFVKREITSWQKV